MKPWWEKWVPSRLDYELDELRAAGIPFELDKEAFSRGVVVIRLSPTVNGERIDIIAKYPDLYPYFRFQVEAPALNLQRHQNPFSKNLCLIGRGTEHWDSDDTLAKFITEQLPLVLKAARSQDETEVAEIEQHQGEPFSDYYPYLPDSIVLIDSSWKIDPAVKEGELTIGVDQQADLLLRGVVHAVKDRDGQILAGADPAWDQLYPRHLRFRWVRMSRPLRESDHAKFLDQLITENPELRSPWYKSLEGGHIDVIGVLFPEEARWRESADGWVFLVRTQRKTKRGYQREQVYFARAGRAGREDMKARIPQLAHLSTCKVTQIGLGGIGGPSAIEWARCGLGELRVVDFDYIDPGTAVRWPLGIQSAGLSKAMLLRHFITTNWPYTKVVDYSRCIGTIRNSEVSDAEVLNTLLDNADLIYDASAEVGVHHLLSILAAERKIPYLLAWATSGAWGGLIARIVPGKTKGCWNCLQWARDDGTIPSPPSDPAGDVQPIGCANPTFTGASFDIQHIALGAIRLGTATLATRGQKGSPDFDWDVAVISMRDSDGGLIAPQWKTFSLQQHPSCSCKNKQK